MNHLDFFASFWLQEYLSGNHLFSYDLSSSQVPKLNLIFFFSLYIKYDFLVIELVLFDSSNLNS